jgi:hypothetical protein
MLKSKELKIPCSKLQGIFDCRVLGLILDSLANPVASYG